MSNDLLVEDKTEYEVTVDESSITQNNYENFRTVIISYNRESNRFKFDENKDKIIDMVNDKIYYSNGQGIDEELKKFENSMEKIMAKCKEANPPGLEKVYINFIAYSEIFFVSVVFVIIWVILILDIVVLAIEVYFFKKIKRVVWKWKEKRLYKKWSVMIREEIKCANSEFKRIGVFWKFHKSKKVIEFTIK